MKVLTITTEWYSYTTMKQYSINTIVLAYLGLGFYEQDWADGCLVVKLFTYSSSVKSLYQFQSNMSQSILDKGLSNLLKWWQGGAGCKKEKKSTTSQKKNCSFRERNSGCIMCSKQLKLLVIQNSMKCF